MKSVKYLLKTKKVSKDIEKKVSKDIEENKLVEKLLNKKMCISFNYKKRKATDDLACNLENSLMRTLIKVLLHDKRL